MTIRQDLTNAFKSLERSLNSNPVQSQVNQVKQNFETAFSSVYKNQGSVVAGFKQVANTTTDVLQNVAGSVPAQVNQQIGVAKLDVSAAEKDLKKKVGSDKTDLQTITGKAALVADGFLDVVIAAPFPEAIATALKTTTTLTGNQVIDVVQRNVDVLNSEDQNVEDLAINSVQNIVGNVFPDFKSVSSQLSNTVSSLAVNSQRLVNVANQGFSSLVENTIEQALSSTQNLLGPVINQSVPKGDLKRIIELKQQNKLSEAAKILSKYSNKTTAELEAVIALINNKASAQVTESKTPVNITVQRTDSFKNTWRETSTDVNNKNVFTPVIGSEVTAEVLGMTREVTEVVVMFLPGPGATIENYHTLYVENYDIGFNPHFYIGYDSVIYRGRPLEVEASSRTKLITNNHNQRSILIAVNIDAESLYHKFAPGQRDKLLLLLDQIIIAKPGIQIYSAADVGWEINAGEDALNVPLFVKQKLGKTNIPNYDPTTQDPLTTTQLANFYVGI
jgi:hypothetical protein